MAVRRRSGHALAGAVAVLLAAAGCGTLPAGGSSGADPTPPAATAATQSPAPKAGAPKTAVPKAAISKAGAPKTAVSKAAVPKTGAPKAGAPKTGAPTTAALLSRGDAGTKVRELQHRLRQLDWFSGDITGRYAASTVDAVQGFQAKRGLAASGAVDPGTWAALTSRSRKPTDDELHNRLTAGPALLRPGADGDRVRDLQARLQQLGWFSGSVTGSYGSVTSAAVQGFQGKRGLPVTGAVDQRTLDRLSAMTRTPTRDQLHNRSPKPSAAGLDPRCMTGRAICVSKTTNTLTWVVDGKAQMRMDVRFGSAELPTREGSFAVGWKSRHHVSTIYHTSMPYAMFFSGGQAVHYSPDFAARGYNGASHGCVNVRNLAGIQSLFAQARVGDKVIVYR